MGIEFKDDAVCYADGEQWVVNAGADSEKYQLVNLNGDRKYSFYGMHGFSMDFQLNTIKQGDYIAASEIDTEQKYNDVVEVFELFGFDVSGDFEWFKEESCRYDLFFIDECKDLDSCVKTYRKLKRKLTYQQIMAIGELKRLEIERDKNSEPNKITPELANKQEVKMQKNKPVVAQVMIDLTERMETGIKTYGEALRANNGRDALQDAYEEALDLACYLKQAMIERDNENTN